MLFKNLAGDTRWAESGGRIRFQIGLTTFGILALELALIRWTSSQVRAFAYFNNVVLITAFLGMGIGVALGKRRPGLVHFTLPALLLIAVPLAAAEPLGLVHMVFPDHTIALWGGEAVPADGAIFIRNLAIFLALLTAVGGVFVFAGAAVGHLFGRVGVLRAYSADLLGSLLGVAAFTAASWCSAGPVVWLVLGGLPFVWLTRRWWSVACLTGILALGAYSVRGAIYSPYNRIDLTQEGWLAQSLAVNRDFHQYLHDLSDGRLADPRLTAEQRDSLQLLRYLYDLPFTINPERGTALVVGAGTGNDVQAARRNGYRAVVSVDIDARILELGQRLHPEQPYSDPRVRRVNEDARAYFREGDERFDVVCFGLLDSHAMASAMSSLRLDNYVYTEEGIRSAWQRVSPKGHLSLTMSCAPGRWFFERLYWTVARATGREPIAILSPLHGGTTTFIVPGPESALNAAELARYQRLKPETAAGKSLTLSDDWPFLYLRPAIMPWGYLVVLGYILLVAVLVVRPVFGVRRGGNGFDWPLFLMGAAFLLIETRGVTSLSLLFGSTWIVNSAVFGGILTMVLLANLAVEHWQWRNPAPWFAALFMAVLVLWWLPVEWLGTLPGSVRGLLSGLITGLPIGLAGVVVPMLLARSTQPAAALGANLLGAVLGGCLEYFSMFAGLKSVALMALALYLFAFLLVRRAGPATSVSVT